MVFVKAWSNIKKKTTRYLTIHGHIIAFSPHSQKRLEERGVCEENVLTLAHYFAMSQKEKTLKKGDRFAIVSEREGLIFVLGVTHVHSNGDLVLTIVTVWNKKDGEFYHHHNNTVLNFTLTRKGPRFFLANEADIKRNDRRRAK